MSMVVAPVNTWQGAPAATTAGFRDYLRFIWHRNWVRGLVWFIVIVGMVAFIADYYQTIFTTPDDLRGFADIAQAPSMAALVGVIDNPATMGGAIWCKGWMFLSLMLGIGMVYLMTRNLRGDEDAGRLELMRAYPLGVHSPMASSVVLTAAVCVASGIFSALALIGLGVGNAMGDIPATGNGGAWAFGASIAVMGLLGVGIAAVTNQVAPSGGAANGLGIGVFIVFYVIRMVGDLQGIRALLWVSPIGWGELVDPWSANRVLPIVLSAVLAIVLVAIGWAIESRRDMGAGMVAQRAGAAHASKLTQTVAGLGARTQRASIVVWCIGMVFFGALLGSVITKMYGLLQGSGLNSAFASSANATVAMVLSMIALAVGIFAVQSASALRSDEERGVLEAQLAGGVSRLGWALRRLGVTLVSVVVLLALCGYIVGAVSSSSPPVADPNNPGVMLAAVGVGTALGAVFAHLPAIIILMGVAVLGFGWWPKVATPVVWGVVGALWAVVIIGVALRLPSWVMNGLPFIGGPHLPSESMNWAKDGIFLAVGLVFIVVGLIGFRRRDVPA